MQRLKDYLNFTAWFAGLGYGLLWLFQAAGALPLGLHVIGLVTLIFASMQLGLLALRRAQGKSTPGAALPKAISRARRPEPLPTVKPRTQFGLRGTPH